jgi:hypothetical protein
MTTPIPMTKAPSRRVIERGQVYRHHLDVLLSCGHTLCVRAFSRYHHAKTLGCLKCQAGTPVGPEDVL